MCMELHGHSPILRGELRTCPQLYKDCPQIEIVNVRDFLLEHKDQLKFYMNLHSYGEMVLLPWGYTEEKPDNIDQLTEVRNCQVPQLGVCIQVNITGGDTGC